MYYYLWTVLTIPKFVIAVAPSRISNYFGELFFCLLYFSENGETINVVVCGFLGVSVSCSIFTMACIAIDRFCAILFPYKKYIDQRRCNIMIGLCWFFAVLLQSPTLYAMKITTTMANYTTCIEDWEPLFDNESSPKIYTVILFVSMYMFPLLVIAILYAAISLFLLRHKTPGSSLTKARKDRSKAVKVIRMLVIIVVVFAVCWLPIFVTQFMMFFSSPKCGVSPHLQFIGFFLSHANSAFNPAIYWIFNDNFRAGFKQLLKSWFCPWSPVSYCSRHNGDSLEMQSALPKSWERVGCWIRDQHWSEGLDWIACAWNFESTSQWIRMRGWSRNRTYNLFLNCKQKQKSKQGWWTMSNFKNFTRCWSN